MKEDMENIDCKVGDLIGVISQAYVTIEMGCVLTYKPRLFGGGINGSYAGNRSILFHDYGFERGNKCTKSVWIRRMKMLTEKEILEFIHEDMSSEKKRFAREG